jgi:hypothetical protein
LDGACVESWIGSVGNSTDNAQAETITELHKKQLIRLRGHWPHIDAIEYGTLECSTSPISGVGEPIGNVPQADLG